MRLNKIVSSIVRVSGITIISRILGYVRDVIVAAYLGTGLFNDVFIATFKVTNLFRSIFAEGAFSAAFIPVFLSTKAKEGENAAIRFASDAQSVLIVVLLIFTTVMIAYMPVIVAATTPGFTDTPYAFNLAVYLGRILSPYIIFISLAALYGGVMNSVGIFSPFAATSIVLNIVMIVAALCEQHASTPAHALTYGALTAGILEFLWMLFFAARYKLVLTLHYPKFTSKIRQCTKQMVPSFINFGIVQINVLASMMVASFVPDGMSYIYYADRISQLPIALIGTACATVVLPALSHAFELEQRKEIEKVVCHSMELVLFFAIPSMFGILYLAHDIIRVLFMRGAFSELSVQNTASSLIALSIGIPAFSLNRVLTAIFYSHRDTRTPMKISMITMVVNIVISFSLLGSMLHVGVSIASSIAGWLNVLCFAVMLKRSSRLYVTCTIQRGIWKIIIASIFMVFCMHVMYVTFTTLGLHIKVFELLCLIFAGLLSYLFASHFLGNNMHQWLYDGETKGDKK